VHNGGEGDVDCGAVCLYLCATERSCNTDADCKGKECKVVSGNEKQCVPNCTDGLPNNGEADTDCGGPCQLKCPVSWHCGGDADCQSSNCDPTGHCQL
jgi:hypothetical protein